MQYSAIIIVWCGLCTG